MDLFSSLFGGGGGGGLLTPSSSSAIGGTASTGSFAVGGDDKALWKIGMVVVGIVAAVWLWKRK